VTVTRPASELLNHTLPITDFAPQDHNFKQDKLDIHIQTQAETIMYNSSEKKFLFSDTSNYGKPRIFATTGFGFQSESNSAVVTFQVVA